MKTLHVFYDAGCDLCKACRAWLGAQLQLVKLHFLPYQSPLARKLCPDLEKWKPDREIVVLDDEGGLYRGAAAWVMVLWATEAYRELSFTLSQPHWMPVARRAVGFVSRHRRRLSSFVPRRDEEWLDRLPPAAGACGNDRCVM